MVYTELDPAHPRKQKLKTWHVACYPVPCTLKLHMRVSSMLIILGAKVMSVVQGETTGVIAVNS
jgi:hypothetical protein